MHCINYAKRVARKTTVVQADSIRSCQLHYQKLNLPSHKLYINILVVIGLSMLNSNQANHIKLCNKLANQKCSHNVLATAGFKHDIVKQVYPRKIIIAS